MPISPIPKLVDGGKVVAYTPIDGRHKPTGKTHHTVHGTAIPTVHALAICQNEGYQVPFRE